MHEWILLFLRGTHQYDGDGECRPGGKRQSIGDVHICLWNRRSGWNIRHQSCGGDIRNEVDKTDIYQYTACDSNDSVEYKSEDQIRQSGVKNSQEWYTISMYHFRELYYVYFCSFRSLRILCFIFLYLRAGYRRNAYTTYTITSIGSTMMFDRVLVCHTDRRQFINKPL